MSTATKTRGHRKERTITPEHSAALQEGRREMKVVRDYLKVIANEGTPNRAKASQRKLESIREMERAIGDRTVPVSQRLALAQELVEIRSDVEEKAPDALLEEQFIEVVKKFSQRRRFDRPTWAMLGVPSEVLDKAGI